MNEVSPEVRPAHLALSQLFWGQVPVQIPLSQYFKIKTTANVNFFQVLLEKRAQQHLNWLEEWWLNTAYLEFRNPVVIYSSPGLVFPFRKFQTQNEQLKYAAKTLLAAMDYKSLIDKYVSE